MDVLVCCTTVLETQLCHVTGWHGRAKIKHGRARHKAQQYVVSYASMPDLCGSPRDDNFQLRLDRKGLIS